MSGDPALDALVAQTQAALGALITKPKLVGVQPPCNKSLLVL